MILWESSRSCSLFTCSLDIWKTAISLHVIVFTFGFWFEWDRSRK